METGDDDYSTETESNGSIASLDFDQIVQEAEAQRVSPRESIRKARKKQKPELKPCAVLPSRLHTIMLMDKHITEALYGQDYEHNKSLRVIGAALRCKRVISRSCKVGEGERESGGEAPDQRHGL
jgi:hypothetical protein